MLTAKILNKSASLNEFRYLATVEFVPGTGFTLAFRLFDTDVKDRRVPPSAAIVTLTFNKTDGTTLDKVSTVIDAGDRSMRKVTLTDLESTDLLGGNITFKLDNQGDGTDVEKGVIQSALSKITLDGCGC